MSRLLAVVVAVSAATVGQASAWQVFRSRADVVPVYVSVTARDGRQIRGLLERDFVILDGGRPRPISVFSSERHPFAVALVLDTTFSMWLGAGLAKQVDMARSIAEALEPDDQVALGSLNGLLLGFSLGNFEVDRVLRSPGAAIQRAFDRQGGESASQQGLEWAISSLSLYDGRRIVVMFTDGQSRPSGVAVSDPMLQFQDPAQLAEQLVRRAERANVSIHALAFDDTMIDESFLSAFATTGGGTSLIARDSDFRAVAREFVDELHHEYLLGFVPSQLDGKSHRIEVKVNRPGAKVRARTRYVAPQIDR